MVTVRAAGATDVGRVRQGNEDDHLVGDRVFAVADGMGGHQGGEVASAMAIDALRSADLDGPDPLEALVSLIRAANHEVLEARRGRPRPTGHGDHAHRGGDRGRRGGHRPRRGLPGLPVPGRAAQPGDRGPHAGPGAGPAGEAHLGRGRVPPAAQRAGPGPGRGRRRRGRHDPPAAPRGRRPRAVQRRPERDARRRGDPGDPRRTPRARGRGDGPGRGGGRGGGHRQRDRGRHPRRVRRRRLGRAGSGGVFRPGGAPDPGRGSGRRPIQCGSRCDRDAGGDESGDVLDCDGSRRDRHDGPGGRGRRARRRGRADRPPEKAVDPVGDRRRRAPHRSGALGTVVRRPAVVRRGRRRPRRHLPGHPGNPPRVPPVERGRADRPPGLPGGRAPGVGWPGRGHHGGQPRRSRGARGRPSSRPRHPRIGAASAQPHAASDRRRLAGQHRSRRRDDPSGRTDGGRRPRDAAHRGRPDDRRRPPASRACLAPALADARRHRPRGRCLRPGDARPDREDPDRRPGLRRHHRGQLHRRHPGGDAPGTDGRPLAAADRRGPGRPGLRDDLPHRPGPGRRAVRLAAPGARTVRADAVPGAGPPGARRVHVHDRAGGVGAPVAADRAGPGPDHQRGPPVDQARPAHLPARRARPRS